MAHDVSFSIPKRKLGTADIEFEIKRDKVMLGTLKISTQERVRAQIWLI